MSSMIQPVSGWSTAAAVSGVKETSGIQKGGDERPVRARGPMMDEYVPEEKQEPSGRYWPGRDKNGRPSICFDAPEKEVPGGQAERCTCSTDQVDREIERLRQRREELKQQLGAETDGAKAEALKRKLARVECELGQKDNDAYRRGHAAFS